MEKSTLYKITIGALVALNLVLVAFLWFGRPTPPLQPFHATERFELDDNQDKQFMASVKVHKLEMQRIDGEQRKILRDYFGTLKGPENSASTPVPPELLRLEEQKIQATYDHFLAVKGFLKPEQLGEYPAFIDFVIQRVVEKTRKNGEPRMNGERPVSNR